MLFGNSQSKRYRLFRLFGFQVNAEPTILLMVVLFLLMGSSGGASGAISSLILIAIVFASIVLHELGHAIAVRRLGYGTSEIVLHGLGGVCLWRGTPTPKHRIIVALSGPGAGLLLGSLVLIPVLIFGLPREFLSHSAISALLYVNLGWSLFNLMPIWPLDGGHVVRSVLERRNSRSETLRLSLQISMGTSGVLIVAAFIFGQTFLAIFLGLILWSNYNESKQNSRPPTSFYGY